MPCVFHSFVSEVRSVEVSDYLLNLFAIFLCFVALMRPISQALFNLFGCQNSSSFVDGFPNFSTKPMFPEISATLLKTPACTIIPSITKLLNFFNCTGTFPKLWTC